ncbi:MAG TPA: glycosyltransferase, partial [Flavobacterium sp.]|nr:glycosyltransferase [Flavobacterium sp.]
NEAILKAHTDLNNQRIIVIENGVDVQQIMEAVSMDKTSIDKKISVTDTLILMVAGFKIPKDQETLIKAMVLLPQNVKLILAGDGPMKEKCVDLAIELGVAARVIFAGVRSDVPSLLKTVDLIVLSSNYEGMSLSCIEGMASGKPFLATDVPGLQELVSGYGVLFECGNVQDFANKITQFLTDEAYYNTVASACESRAKDFDIEQMIERHISLYKNII